MSEPTSDVLLLFTPPKTPVDLPPSDPPPSIYAASPAAVHEVPTPVSGKFYIELPVLSSAQKSQYKSLPDGLATDVELDPQKLDKILGEHREGKKLYYFVALEDGIAHKYRAREFSFKYPKLVREYERMKVEGTLAPFDPTASYVHFKSRIRMTITINKRSLTARSTAMPVSSGGRPAHPNTDDDDDDDSEALSNSEDDEGSQYDQGTSVGRRRSSRAVQKKPIRDLPFSPKKTRSYRIFTTADSEDELVLGDEIEFENAPPRRSTRTRKSAKTNLADDDAYEESDEAEDSDAYDDGGLRGSAKSKAPPKKVARGNASRAAYGHFRVVADLDYDVYSDEETAPLRAHRDFCEKCHRAPAHVMLGSLNKKPNKTRKKKGSDDDLESEGDEEDKLNALGGWVRCLRCPVSAHWRCLASTQRDEILKAARDRDRALWKARQPQIGEGGELQSELNASDLEPGKRAGLDAYQTTEFICGSCMKGGICMGCKDVALEADTACQGKKPESAEHPGQTVPMAVDAPQDASSTGNGKDVNMTDGTKADIPTVPTPTEVLFRCFACKRLSHYYHMPVPPEYKNGEDSVDSVTLATYYQFTTGWQCADCASYKFELDKILAWRPYPPNAVEPPRSGDQPSNHKEQLPREYLVKWAGRSYRRTQWVPHMWLLARNQAKLKNFLASGTKVQLLEEPTPDENILERSKELTPEGEEITGVVPFEIGAEESRDSSAKPGMKTPVLSSDALPDAELRIPPAWKTADRILDVLFWYPEKHKETKAKAIKRKKGRGKSKGNNDEDDPSVDETDPNIGAERDAIFNFGEEPREDLTETVDEWLQRTGKELDTMHIDKVVWCFFKWDDLGYDEATWDSPPRRGEPGYAAFERAFQRYIDSRKVIVPSRKELLNFANRRRDGFRKEHAFTNDAQPVLGQSKQLRLMDFQVDGVNWLCDNWWNLQHCILADDMGLGKTVQIVTFIGTLVDKWKGFPALVVVPNSTITNWVREFERWAPRLRVVPFYGEAKAREVIKQYELRHDSKITGAKYHVLVTTYDCITGRDFTPVFKSAPRWEVLVVDEGQRLKSDHSLLFKKLNELTTIHRIILTGTPLNNNIRELFNLMNFLDPNEWNDLEKLEKEYEVLTEELINQLHNRLRPYFLRRIKSEVLKLPPKNEVIVPVSMAPLQKEVYRSILSQNLNLLRSLTQHSNTKGSTISKSNMNNMLMQMRKCLQHPYLNSEDIEPRGLSPEETQEKLISASAKLRLLKTLLPKLRERGHRVLLFSQFVIALNVIEDFLIGEGIKYLRLDGDTKQADRQKGMDEYNRPGSDVFIYLLTTRAGGVGINLSSADTVIIFDPDFNPHQDLQAIARAYRYGQQKTCLVFKFMVKDSAEERIMQTGKKKLVLDHLIVQKMDDEDSAGGDVQSILTFGAKALFEEDDQNAKDIVYTEHDVEKLIEKTEQEGDQAEPDKKAGLSFAFAKVWSADKDSMEEMAEEANVDVAQTDAWAQTLQRIGAERDKIQVNEITGRGARRRAAALIAQQNLDFGDSPQKDKTGKRKFKSKSIVSDDSDAYTSSIAGGSDREDSDDSSPRLTPGEFGDLTVNPKDKKSRSKLVAPFRVDDFRGPSSFPDGDDHSMGESMTGSSQYRVPPHAAPLSAIYNQNDDGEKQICGLCGTRHGVGACYMTESSENLAEYRQMLLVHAGDEPLEQRRAAIKVIDATLHKRGKLHLINGQPLQLIESLLPMPSGEKHKKSAQYNTQYSSNRQSSGKAREQTWKTKTTETSTPSSLQRSPPPGGPSKRAPSPTDVNSPKKKVKHTTSCPVCGASPHHLVKDCPVVAEGPTSISKAIKRLEPDSSKVNTVKILGKLLRKVKKREVGRSVDSPIPMMPGDS